MVHSQADPCATQEVYIRNEMLGHTRWGRPDLPPLVEVHAVRGEDGRRCGQRPGEDELQSALGPDGGQERHPCKGSAHSRALDADRRNIAQVDVFAA